MKKSESRNLSIKEAFGFREGADVEVFLVDQQSDRADRLGYLRPEYGSSPRLYERFSLNLSTADQLSVFFGQTETKPFVIKLEPETAGTRAGRLQTELFQAVVALSLVSPYNPGVYVLTVEVKRNEKGQTGSASGVLPDAWKSQPE